MRKLLRFLSRTLQDASIRSKLLIAPIVLILALAIVSSLAIIGLSVQAEALRRVNDIILNRITLIDRFVLMSEQVQSDVYQISVLRFMGLPEQEIQPVQTRLEQGVNELKITYGEIVTKWPLDDTEQALVKQMKAPMDEFVMQAQQAVDIVTVKPSFGVLMVRSSTNSFTRFREPLRNLLEYQHKKIARTQRTTIQVVGSLKTSTMIFVILTVGTGIVTSLFISTRLIAYPIQETTEIMSKLAKNDLIIQLHGLERRDEIGAMLRAVEVFRNNAIEKERVDKELQESQERLLMAQEIAHVGNWELDLSSKTIWASEEAFRIYGLKRTSPYLPLDQAQKVPVSEDRPRLDTALKELLQNKAPYDEEFRIMRPNENSPRVVHSIANLVCDRNGTPFKVVGVIQDITDQAQAEAALRQSEEKFSKAFHTSSYAITITQVQDGKFVDVNEAFTTITGFTREEALTSSTFEFNLWVNVEDRQRLIDGLRAGKAVIGEEFYFRRKNGEIFTGQLSAQAIQLSQGHCILSSINDITERKLAEEKLKVFSTELERSNKELEQFAFIASHDLQEPLRMVTSYLQLFERRYKDKLDGDALEFINYAVDGSIRMKTLITDLLAYSRVGTRGKEFIRIESEDVLMNVLHDLQLSIEEAGPNVTHDPLPEVMADAVQLGSLFQNLVNNAIKFRSKHLPKSISV